jgi:hypothetical protein
MRWRDRPSKPLYDFLDSYDHYRRTVGLGVLGAAYRALYYEIHGGVEPKKWRGR